MLEELILAACLWVSIPYIVAVLLWPFVKLAEASWAPWNQPEYDELLRIEPQKKGNTNGQA